MMNVLLFFLALAGMELVARWSHQYIMHGWGWAWHKSHHEAQGGGLELNDLYALFFAGVATSLFALGANGPEEASWIAAGMTAYGLLYFLVHDGLVHQRWPFRMRPRRGYLKRLYQAHRLHHAVRGREGCVSFGFLYAPPLPRLKAQLRARRDVAATGPE